MVSVNSSGKVSGLKPGVGRVTAQSGSASGLASISVGQGAIASLALSPSTASLEAGKTQQFVAQAREASGNILSGVSFTWSSASTSVATVSGAGLATGVAAGQTTIQVAVGSISKTATLTVVAPPKDQLQKTSGDGQSGFVGSQLPQPLKVRVLDGSSAPLPGRTVSWTVASGGGSVSASSSSTDAQGYAQVTWTLGPIAGGNTVSATLAGVGSVGFQASGTVPSSAGGLVFGDGFESGDVVYKLNGYGWVGSMGPNNFVTKDKALSGSYSLAFRFPGKPDLAADGSSERRFTFGAILPEVWIEYYLFIPENYVHRDGDGGDNNKFFVLWGPGTYPGGAAGRLSVFLSAERLSDSWSKINMSWSGESTPAIGAYSPEFTFPRDAKGRWNQIRIHARPSSSANWPGDGAIEIWWDGILMASMRDYTRSTPRPFYDPDEPGIQNGYLFGWANSGYTEDTVFFVDDFKVYSSNPGW